MNWAGKLVARLRTAARAVPAAVETAAGLRGAVETDPPPPAAIAAAREVRRQRMLTLPPAPPPAPKPARPLAPDDAAIAAEITAWLAVHQPTRCPPACAAPNPHLDPVSPGALPDLAYDRRRKRWTRRTIAERRGP